MVWEVATWKELATLRGHKRQVLGVAFSPDGILLASVACPQVGPGEIKLWDVSTWKDKATWKHGGGDLAFSPDSLLLATPASTSVNGTAGVVGAAHLWYVGTSKKKSTVTGHEGLVDTVAFSPDGTLLAAGGRDGLVKLWDMATGKEKATLTGHTDQVNCVAFSGDGKHIASASNDKTVRIWNMPKIARARGND